MTVDLDELDAMTAQRDEYRARSDELEEQEYA